MAQWAQNRKKEKVLNMDGGGDLCNAVSVPNITLNND